MICGLHLGSISEEYGGNIRMLNVLMILKKIFDMDVILYISDNSNNVKTNLNYKNFIDIRRFPKPFLIGKTDSIFLYMFPKIFEKQLKRSELVSLKPKVTLIESPFMGYCTLKVMKFPNDDSLKIYDSQNIEVNYYKHHFNYLPFKKQILKKIEKIQEFISNKADIIFSPSMDEIKIFEKKYRINSDKLILVPQGVDTSIIKPINYQHKKILKENIGWKYSFHVVFLGSKIKPNIDACKIIINNISKRLPNVAFIIIGNVSDSLDNVPSNVKNLGILPFSEKNNFLQMSDVAINPVWHGAGTNGKMIEYLSAGLPIVTTQFGARGLDLIHNEDAIIDDDTNNFAKHISEIIRNDYLNEKLQRNARIKSKAYDWENIALNIKNNLQKYIS